MSRFRPLPISFYRRPAETVARDLLGRYLVRQPLDGERGRRLVLRLVETEAYLGAPDRASHAWDGRRTPRNESLYLPGGHAYVYFIYGMHWCLNAVTGEKDIGSAVLLRAGEPVEGEDRMIENRSWPRLPRPGDLAGGPGKLCQALGVDRSLDGVLLNRPPLFSPAASRCPTRASPPARASASTTRERPRRGRCASRCGATDTCRGPGLLPCNVQAHVFLSYSHEDEKWKDELSVQLNVLETCSASGTTGRSTRGIPGSTRSAAPWMEQRWRSA